MTEEQERWACVAINNLGRIFKYDCGGNFQIPALFQ
jgi:hypothetical protein